MRTRKESLSQRPHKPLATPTSSSGHRLGELRSAAARLGAVSRVGSPSSFAVTCGLVQALVAAMERCLEAGLKEHVMLAGLPADLVRRLDAHLSNETVMAASTQQTGDVDGRGRGSAPLEQASNPRAWLKRGSAFEPPLINGPGQLFVERRNACLMKQPGRRAAGTPRKEERRAAGRAARRGERTQRRSARHICLAERS